jgi:predicted phosphate transport protein (TIGR00153 family)
VPFQVIPRELAFFDLFDRLADAVVRGAVDLTAMLSDLEHAERHAQRIRDLEHDGDDLTHQIMKLLNTTFVTPIDRKDIHTLASSLDDVLDSAEALADLLVLLRIDEPLPQFTLLVDVLQRATVSVAAAVRDLRHLRGLDRAIADIKRQEHEGDWVYRRGVAALYSGDYDAMEVIMWKDLLHEAEGAVDRCEDIANTLESVMLKFA